MNYKENTVKDFEVAGHESERSVSVGQLQDGSFELVVFESTKYMQEHDISVPLSDYVEVARLIIHLKYVHDELVKNSLK